MNGAASSDESACGPVRAHADAPDAGDRPERGTANVSIEAGRTSRRLLVRWLGVAFVLAMVATAIVIGRNVIADAWNELGRVSGAVWIALVALWAAWTLLRAAIQKWSLTRVDLPTATLMSEAGEAATWLPIGGLGSFAIRTSFGRTVGLGTPALVMSFLIASEAVASALWILVGVAAIVDLRRGTADALDHAGLIAACLGLGGTLIGMWIIVSANRVTEFVVRVIVRAHDRLARRWPRLDQGDVRQTIESARVEGAVLIRRRAAGLLGLSTAAHLATATILWLALRSLGHTGGWLSLVALYAPVKAAVGFAPTPGGVGFAEAGLTGALVASGVPIERAVAAVAIYRLFTGLIPLASGSIAGFWWLRRRTVR